MNTTFNLELSGRKGRNGLYEVFLRITQEKKHKRLKLGISIPDINQWGKEVKNKKGKKKSSIFLCVASGLIVVWLAIGAFLFLSKPSLQAGIYVSLENSKQGDTVFIKVTSQAKNVVGNLGQQKLYFYKN